MPPIVLLDFQKRIEGDRFWSYVHQQTRIASSEMLSQAATREANVLAYDDVFRLVAVMAAATFLYLLFLLLRRTRRARQAARLAMEQGA